MRYDFYKCSQCEHENERRLWRPHQSGDVKLLCKVCAEKDQGKKMNVGTLEIGLYIPAIPAPPMFDEETYWGYCLGSVPPNEMQWWLSLPVSKP